MTEHNHTRDCDCLPIRVVVDQHGHYWRDYGDHWSMCPVSDENVATEPVTEFYQFGRTSDARDSADPAMTEPRDVLAELPRLRLTGEQLDGLGHGLNTDDPFAIDFDEYDEFVRLDDVRAMPDHLLVRKDEWEPDIDLPTLAEAIRLWYVETGRNPVTKNWDQPAAGWLIAKYKALRVEAHVHE